MAEQLNTNKKQNVFKIFLQFQKQILEYVPNENINFQSKNKPLAFMTLEELFAFLDADFFEFYEIENLDALVPFIHRSLRKWSKNWYELSSDIGITLFYLLEKHMDDESEITVVVKIINTIVDFLKTMENIRHIKISGKAFVQLAELLPTIKKGKLASEIISCLQHYIEMYPDNQHGIVQSLCVDLSERLVKQTSDKSSTNGAINILDQFLDELYLKISEDATIIATIHQLLISEQRVSRKSGYHLCRKMIGYLVNKSNN